MQKEILNGNFLFANNHLSKADKGIRVWTVNTEEDLKEALLYDIDGVITDRPLMVTEVLRRQNQISNLNESRTRSASFPLSILYI